MAITSIEWTATQHLDGSITPGFTFNPWIGCTKVSLGCVNCYAETLMDRRYGRVQWGAENPRQRTSEANWRKPYQWDKKARVAGTTPSVFCSSLADWLDDEVPIDWLADLLVVIANTPSLRWLLLTKRPQNYAGRVTAAFEHLARTQIQVAGRLVDMLPGVGVPGLSNVAIGVTVENRQAAAERLPILDKIPAQMRFVSAEPLLGSFDPGSHKIDWLICGGESGFRARQMDLAWARRLRNHCSDQGIPFFMKQLGCNWADSDSPACDGYQGSDKHHDIKQFPWEFQVREFPLWLQPRKEVM